MRKGTKDLMTTLMAAPLGAVLAALLSSTYYERGKPTAATSTSTIAAPTCDYSVNRVRGFKYVRPLLALEPACESPAFALVEHRIDSAVTALRAKGVLTNASVYLRDLTNASWMSYNDTAHYFPGSMLKLPVLIAWLRMAEDQPGLLDRKYVFKGKEPGWPVPDFPPARELEVGRSYSVRELLERMIVESDNLATSVLTRNIEPAKFEGIFSELGFVRPSRGQSAYPMTAREYANFWKALYNGGLLPPEDADYALGLLSRSAFKSGMRSGIGSGLDIASKFGEAGMTGAKQLHESGIVYLKDHPYMITIMTLGPDMYALPPVLAELSGIVHEHMASK